MVKHTFTLARASKSLVGMSETLDLTCHRTGPRNHLSQLFGFDALLFSYFGLRRCSVCSSKIQQNHPFLLILTASCAIKMWPRDIKPLPPRLGWDGAYGNQARWTARWMDRWKGKGLLTFNRKQVLLAAMHTHEYLTFKGNINQQHHVYLITAFRAQNPSWKISLMNNVLRNVLSEIMVNVIHVH